MTSRIYWINTPPTPGTQLGIMPRPRGNDWLSDEIRSLQAQKVDYVVSLLEDAEIWDLQLTEEKALCAAHHIHYRHFPIPDVSTSANEAGFLDLTRDLARAIRDEQRVVIHCRMGIGRSSTLAAAVLIRLGVDPKQVFTFIEQARGLQVPDTEQQADWVLSRTDKILR